MVHIKNKYDINYEKNEVYIHISNKNVITIIDLEDFEKVSQYSWYVDNYGYVVNKSYGYNLKLHRLVTNCGVGMTVDHIFHNTLDNRKSKLRVCTQQEQTWNLRIPVSNTSGVKGVWFDKSRNKWCAEILNIKKKVFKRFNTKEEAVAQRKEWEIEYFGNFNYQEVVAL